jgi:hypothetical protein
MLRMRQVILCSCLCFADHCFANSCTVFHENNVLGFDGFACNGVAMFANQCAVVRENDVKWDVNIPSIRIKLEITLHTLLNIH